jgi:hypothetical protein
VRVPRRDHCREMNRNGISHIIDKKAASLVWRKNSEDLQIASMASIHRGHDRDLAVWSSEHGRGCDMPVLMRVGLPLLLGFFASWPAEWRKLEWLPG